LKIPLIIRILALITMAWRLIIIAKKENPLVLKPSLNLLDLPKSEPLLLAKNQRTLESVKAYYRGTVRGQETDNQTNMLIYLLVLVNKDLKKGGIFRFIWYKPEFTFAFFQSLNVIDYPECKTIFEQILSKINPKAMELYAENTEAPNTEDFIVDGNMDKTLFEEFDDKFKIDIYLKKIMLYVSKG
jgi:hypothetical protein